MPATEPIDVAPLPTAPGPIVQPPKRLNQAEPTKPRETVGPFGWVKIAAETDSTNVYEQVHAKQLKGQVLIRTSSRSLRNGQMQILSESTVVLAGTIEGLELKPKSAGAK